MKKNIFCIALMTLFFGCKKTQMPVQREEETSISSSLKETDKNLKVTTQPVTPTSAIYAIVSGEIANGNANGNNISETGFCYGTSPGLTINNDTIHGIFPYSIYPWMFRGSIPGLTPGTLYYVRAYLMKNNGDVYYGNEESFTTLTIGAPAPGIGTVTDIDGNVYHTITLGTQVWMVENLKTTHYNDGTSLPNVTDNTAWANATSGTYCDYANNPANSTDYGRLYNLYAIKDSRKLAPAGWHIPSFSEWVTALYYLGGGGIAGGRMKEAGFTHWDYPNTGADNSSWFTALGSGFRSAGPNAPFVALKRRAVFWSSSSDYSFSPSSPFITAIILADNSASWSYQQGSIGGGTSYGYTVRCVKD